MILGVGTGESMNEVPVGVDWPEQSERFARLRESVQLIQALSAPGAEFVDFEGQYYRTHEATIYDKPDQPVPIYIAASGPAAARLAGRLADGFICTTRAKARSCIRTRSCRPWPRGRRRPGATRPRWTG